jgi:glycosyltransferase involved in cell wall biosynthesis
MDVQDRPKEKGYEQRLRELLQLIPLVLVRSQSIAERLQQFGCDSKKIRMNRTGIPLSGFPPVERTFPSEGRWSLVQACRFVPKKGLFTTLEAFRLFRQKFPSAHLTIAGDGPLYASVNHKIQELQIDSSVTLAGFGSGRFSSGRIFSCIRVTPPRTATRKVCRTLCWRRWLAGCQWSRPGMVVSRKRLKMASMGT